MDEGSDDFIEFERPGFSARIPARRLHTRSHFWLAEIEPGLWRVGLAEFAARTLGEIVEICIDAATGARIAPGEPVGWIEGFKAVSDLVAVGAGEFAGANAEALDDPSIIQSDPCGAGWLYAFRGEPAPEAIDASTYAVHIGSELDNLRLSDCPEGPPK